MIAVTVRNRRSLSRRRRPLRSASGPDGVESEGDYISPARTPSRGIPIYSRDHFLLSVAVGAVAALGAGVEPLVGVGWVVYAAAVGVGIDVDHFLIAWYNAGSPRAIRYCLENPSAVVTDQDTIFRPSEVTKLERLLSHVVIGGLLVTALAVVAPATAVLTAAVLYVHVLADLLADVRDGKTPDRSPD